MSRYCQNRFIRDSEVMQVRCRTAAECVQAVPRGANRIPRVLGRLFAVFVASLPAMSTDIECGQDLTVQKVAHTQRRAFHRTKDRATCGIAPAQPELIEQPLHGQNYGNGSLALARLCQSVNDSQKQSELRECRRRAQSEGRPPRRPPYDQTVPLTGRCS
jgi:hypothetical protein